MQEADYLLNLLHICADDALGQDAIEWAIVCGHIHLTFNFELDRSLIQLQFPEILEGYQRTCHENCDALIDSYQPLLDQVLCTNQ